MRIKSLQLTRVLRTALLSLLLGATGMMKGYAYYYDFSAECSTGQMLYYHITDVDNHYVELTCPWGPNFSTSYTWSGFTKPSGEIVLPESVEYDGIIYTVSSIGGSAFYGCNELTGNLTIPNSVVSIGSHSFDGCNGFTGSLIIPNSVTFIGSCSFKGCSGFIGNLIIPNSVTEIGSDAFNNCLGFTGELNIPNSVISIGISSFYGCSGLSSITIPTSVSYIGGTAFYGTGWYNSQTSGILYLDGCCIGYKGAKPTGSLQIEGGTRLIASSAFSGCDGLTGSLTIPNSVTTIGYYAFSHCGFTGDLIIPNSVSSIGTCAFDWCTSFTGNLILGNSLVTIGEGAFYRCTGFTGSLIIPNSVISIGNNAFCNCSGFTGTLTIGNSVKSIGNGAFQDCSGFTGNLVIPNSVINIGDVWAHDMPNGVFSGCSGFTGNLIIGNSVTTIGIDAFSWCTGLTGSVTIPNSVKTIGCGAFIRCEGLTSINIPSSVTSLGNGVFLGSGWYNNQPNGVLYLDNCCLGYKGEKPTGILQIAEGTRLIAAGAFYGCSDLTGNLVIPNSVTIIGIDNDWWDDGVFSECTSITSVTLGNSVTMIGGNAFYDCNRLIEVNLRSYTAPYLGFEAFTNNATGRVINIPCNATPNYSTGYWTEWADALHEVCDVYTITTTVDPVDGGTASGGGTFDYAATCTLIATPNPGYHFVNWTKDDIEVSTEATYSFVVSEDGAYVANFAANVYFISVGANPTNGGTVTGGNSGGYGSLVTLIATPNEGYCFVNWTKNGEIVSTEPTYSFMVTESAAYQANFAQQSFHFTTAGNWSVASNWLENELPGSTDQVFINANCTLDTNAEAVALTVDSDIVLTIQETNTLSISGTITTPSTTSLIIADGGQLVTDNAVNGTIQKSIAGYGESEDGYYFIASPVDDFDPNDGGLLTSNYDLYYFDQAQEGEEWRNYEAASFNLNTGKGYLYASQTDVTLNISGELTAAKEPVELVNQAGVVFEGWNLIGNPYPCNVTINVPFYRMYSDGSGLATQTTNLETTAIKPMEGVFVQYTTEAPSVTFTKAPNVSAEGSRGALNLSLSQGRGVKDNAIIRFDGGKTLEKFSLRKGGSSIFITEGNKDYAVVNAEKQGEIPVSFKTEKNGSYTLSFSNEDVEFSYLHLIDNMTGNDVDLLHTPSYSFEAKTTDYASRFRLVFSTDGNANDESFGFVNAMGNFCIYGIEGDATVQVIDAMGRILSSETFSGSYEKQLGGAAGVYVVRLINGDSVRTQKIVVR